MNAVFNPVSLVRHPFAVIQSDDVDDAMDKLVLILPLDAMPQKSEDEFVSVNLDRGVVYWRGQDGRIHAISQWYEETPTIDSSLREALIRDEGVLVLFMYPGEGEPQHWALFKCHVAN